MYDVCIKYNIEPNILIGMFGYNRTTSIVSEPVSNSIGLMDSYYL
jgi:hypothetical protein